jgi:thiosulfate/3-mercaptopyruvate sulfurtransferase
MTPFVSHVVWLLLAPLAADPQPAGYPRPELLIEAADLAKPDAAGKFIVLDARGKKEYQVSHVPGAVWLDPVTWMRSFGDGQDTANWVKLIGAVGVSGDKPVVLYDDNRHNNAARIWWILRYWGIRDVRILNGGWRAWKAAQGPLETTENKPQPTTPKLEAQSKRLATKSQVLDSLKERSQILDARSTDEYCGVADTAKRNGAIPGAIHLEWTDTLDKTTGRFKTRAELTRLFEEAAIDLKRPATTYCQSGGRAAVLAFALELMGGQEVRNYYRSWSEWGNTEDTPIVKPKPGK